MFTVSNQNNVYSIIDTYWYVYGNVYIILIRHCKLHPKLYDIYMIIGVYTRSPLEDSRLFGPSPWKTLATTYEQMGS